MKVADRLLPFMMNLNTQGKAWKEQGVRKSQVLQINQVTAKLAPKVYQWMLTQIETAVERKWLIDS